MQKQKEWYEQWKLLEDNELFLFEDWIYPNKIEDFRDKEVLEVGCGGGQHTSFVAPFAKHITAIDLNTIDIAKERNKKLSNITFLEEDILKMNLEKKFDYVFSVGVLHHTNCPRQAFKNIDRKSVV